MEYDHTVADLHVGSDSRTTRLRPFFEFKPKLPGDATTTLEYNLVDYRFSDANRNYTEQYWKVALNWRL